jgi:hypothetical protein
LSTNAAIIALGLISELKIQADLQSKPECCDKAFASIIEFKKDFNKNYLRALDDLND